LFFVDGDSRAVSFAKALLTMVVCPHSQYR